MENTEFLSNGRPKISPRAYSIAIQNGIDIRTITPTGPEGRIIENDILKAIEARDAEKAALENPAKTPETDDIAPEEEACAEAAPEEAAPAEEPAEAPAAVSEEKEAEPAAEEVSETKVEACDETAPEAEEAAAPAEEAKAETAIVKAPVTAVTSEEETDEEAPKQEEKPFREEPYRHTDVIIAESENAPDGAPVTIQVSFDASALVDLRDMLKENGEVMGLPNVTLNDMLLFAVAKTLKKHKAMNAHFLGDRIRYFEGVHLGFSVDTDRGPKTLTVFDADRLSLSSLSKITGALVRGLRSGGEVPEKNQRPGSFTVVNVGAIGVEGFTAKLTAPQTGALAVMSLREQIAFAEGEIVSYPAIPMALTFDPRAMSTANAAKFLHDLRFALENFHLLLIK